jgi:hypothetical protein
MTPLETTWIHKRIYVVGCGGLYPWTLDVTLFKQAGAGGSALPSTCSRLIEMPCAPSRRHLNRATVNPKRNRQSCCSTTRTPAHPWQDNDHGGCNRNPLQRGKSGCPADEGYCRLKTVRNGASATRRPCRWGAAGCARAEPPNPVVASRDKGPLLHEGGSIERWSNEGAALYNNRVAESSDSIEAPRPAIMCPPSTPNGTWGVRYIDNRAAVKLRQRSWRSTTKGVRDSNGTRQNQPRLRNNNNRVAA